MSDQTQHDDKHTFLPRLAGLEPPLDDLGIGSLVPHLCPLAGGGDRNRRARHPGWMAHTLGPRVVAVLEELAHFAGLAVLEVQLDVVLRAPAETVRGGRERGVAGSGVLPGQLTGVPAFARGPSVLGVC